MAGLAAPMVATEPGEPGGIHGKGETMTATATAAKCCDTCRHMATHARCDGCLRPPGEPFGDFLYLHHEPGDWRTDLARAILSGERNIVIGWQGEAECNVNWTPARTYASVRNVAEQCGYMVSAPVGQEDGSTTMRVWTTEGEFDLHWPGERVGDCVQAGVLDVIYRLRRDADGNPLKPVVSWARADFEVFAA